MWEALFAFHIRVAQLLAELLRCPAVERTVGTLAVVLLTPDSQRTPDIVQRPEPGCVEALVAQPAVEALDVSVLHRAAPLDVDQPDLAVAIAAVETGAEAQRFDNPQIVARAFAVWSREDQASSGITLAPRRQGFNERIGDGNRASSLSLGVNWMSSFSRTIKVFEMESRSLQQTNWTSCSRAPGWRRKRKSPPVQIGDPKHRGDLLLVVR